MLKKIKLAKRPKRTLERPSKFEKSTYWPRTKRAMDAGIPKDKGHLLVLSPEQYREMGYNYRVSSDRKTSVHTRTITNFLKTYIEEKGYDYEIDVRFDAETGADTFLIRHPE